MGVLKNAESPPPGKTAFDNTLLMQNEMGRKAF